MGGREAPASMSLRGIAVCPGALASGMRGTQAMRNRRDMAVTRGSTTNPMFLEITRRRELGLMEGRTLSLRSGSMLSPESRSRIPSARRRPMAVLRARHSQRMLQGLRVRESQARMILPGPQRRRLLPLSQEPDVVILHRLEVEDWRHGCTHCQSRLGIMEVLH